MGSLWSEEQAAASKAAPSSELASQRVVFDISP
jgi:hypothetical protein